MLLSQALNFAMATNIQHEWTCKVIHVWKGKRLQTSNFNHNIQIKNI
jgi:hypothetical protein